MRLSGLIPCYYCKAKKRPLNSQYVCSMILIHKMTLVNLKVAFIIMSLWRCWHYLCVCVCVRARSVVFNSLQPYGLQTVRLPCPWDFSHGNTGPGCHLLLQGIFPIQGSNSHSLYLLHCRQILYPVSHLGDQKNPRIFLVSSKGNGGNLKIFQTSIPSWRYMWSNPQHIISTANHCFLTSRSNIFL